MEGDSYYLPVGILYGLEVLEESLALEVLIPPLIIRIKTGSGLMFEPHRDYPSANRAVPSR